ncbi:hypothetical protein KY290_014246 [Solanum tuberosum]|uniref:Uncharacterized protein n=1 Tax=Solanum tuberosum TaxID=4113 RepID=A0ABQ7VR27_SOLTU|nr:hypothetical protein KY290_014246 [Solanum tuberosum]
MAQARSRVKQLRELLFPILGQVILKPLQQMHLRLVLEMMKTMNVNGSVHLVEWMLCHEVNRAVKLEGICGLLC